MVSLKGHLLIADGGLLDPNFRRTVVLVVDHDDEGAAGVILNRPGSMPVREAVPTLGGLVDEAEPVYVGGPVGPDAAVLLADFSDPSIAEDLVFGTIGMLGDLPSDGSEGIGRLRVFGGYAGWGPGQLEEELSRDDWVTDIARPSDVFTTHPRELWAEVLKRKGGRFELLATMPLDPSLN